MFIINEPELAHAAKQVIKKVWGTEFVIVNEELYCCKLLKLTPGFQCSIHAHGEKDETFIGVQGNVVLHIHNPDKSILKSYPITPGTKRHIFPQTFHSFEANNVAWIMEVSTNHDDADVVRLQESRNLNEIASRG